MKELLEKYYDHKFDEFNAEGVCFHDAALLSVDECEQLIDAINAKLLVESGNAVAKHLRNLLSLSIDIQRTEDALCELKDNSWRETLCK